MAERKLIGHIGVDSGQVIICDPAYIESQQIYERFEAMQEQSRQRWLAARKQGDKEAARSAWPQTYQIPYLMGHEGCAVGTRSGIGDGFYPVYALVEEMENWGERVVRLEVDFTEHPWLETVPIEMPDAVGMLLDHLAVWLPQVEGADAEDFLRRVTQIREVYSAE